jgi:hypothetical protein
MLEFLFELVAQLIGELLVDLTVHAVGESRTAVRRIAQIAVYAALGAAVGAVSLFVLPVHFIKDDELRLLALIAIPVIAGVFFSAVGRRRQRKGKDVSALEAFLPASSFAAAMAAVRYFGAE